MFSFGKMGESYTKPNNLVIKKNKKQKNLNSVFIYFSQFYTKLNKFSFYAYIFFLPPLPVVHETQ